jgi:NAD(P)-dependent dehydrogenase (short-subunit alcohol dehydrogenase family)
MSLVVLVTGASSGIGLSVAQILTQKGHVVYGTSRHASMGQKQHGFTMLQLDVTSESSIASAIEYIMQHTGRLDVLVNNAGLGLIGPIENTSDSEAREIFETNVFGVLNMCRICLPHLRISSNPYIINITSMAAQMGLPYRGIYSASKFAVEGFTESLSMEVKKFGIRVVLIEPGDYKTNINSTRKIVGFVDRSVYGAEYDRVMEQVHREVAQAPTPEGIGRRIANILTQSNPPLRYRVANIFTRFSLTLMRVLPSRLFEKMLMRFYGMGKKHS